MDLAGMKRRQLQALCKRHGLPAGGSNADLVARLDAALSGTAGAEEEVAGVAARKGCLKHTGGDAVEAKKVTFAVEEGKARRLRSRVIWSPVVAKTRGKSAQAGTDSAAEDGISAEAGADVPVRRSRRNSLSAAEAEEVGEAVAVDRKRKRKNQENDEGVAVSAQVGVSSRVTRRSSLVGAAAVLPPAVEKKRGRGKAAAGSNKLAAEVQDCEPDVQNYAQVEVSARITRSRSIAPVVMSPTVVENKRRRKTGDARTNVELPTVSDVPRNEAPVTRSLRNRVVQVNNSMVDETHTARQLENKTQPSRPPTRRHQQVSSSVEDKSQEQIAAPNKAPLLRRSLRNYSEDANKQPAVKEVVKRSTRKSVVLATLEKVENDLIEEKNPEAHVRRSMRKSIVPVKDIKGIGEEIKNASSEDAAKQPATKGPVRGSRRKSVVSELHEKEKGLTAEKNMEAHEGKSMRKPVMPVKDIKAVGEGIQNAKGKDVEKQFVVKQPTRRPSRKSVLPVMLENNSGLLAAEMNAEMNVRRSTRKSVLPSMLNEENQDHNKMARNENFQSGECQDDERQQKVKEPIRRSRQSVAAVPLEEQSNGLHEEKMSKNPMRRSTRKSVALDEVEKVSMDHTEIVAQEPERVGEEGLKLRKHRRSSLEISSSANDSWRKQQNAQVPNEKDNTGGTQQASNSTTSKGRSSKRRRTTAPEEVMPVKEANDDIIIREATKDAHKATHEYNKESSSKVQEICQVNATREEFSSGLGPLLVTVALTDEICTAQSKPVVIPGSESGDNANESSDKSKQPQEHSDTQAVDSHLSETRSGKLDQSTCIAGLVPHNCVVSEDKALMSEDGLSIDFTVGDREEQSPVSGEGRVGLEANASEPGEKNLANVMSTGLHAKSLQHDTDIIAEETDKDVLPMAFPIEEHGEKYAVSPVAVEKSVGWEASAGESAGKPLTGIFSNDLHTEHLQHDCDVLTKETGEASGAAPPISESDTNPEIQCNAEESIRAADLGKCPSRGSKGNLYSTSLHLEGAADDCILPVLNADKGFSSDGRPSSFGLELLFAEACKESYSKNIENTAVEIDGGNKPSTPVTPCFYLGSVCLEDEDVQPTGCDADKNLDVDQGVAGEENIDVTRGFYVGSDLLEDEDVQPTGCDADKKLDVDQGVIEEEVLAQEKFNDQHVPAKTDLKMKLNDELAGPGMESGCSITEKNERLVADNLDQEGDLEKPSLCSATPECKHECGLPEETVLPSKNTGPLPSAEKSPFGLESLFSQESIDESVGHGALASATAHTENGFDDSEDCHVKSALENALVSEPFSHHETQGGISKNVDCMHTSQQDNGMEGLPEANPDEERVLSVSSLDAKHIKEGINSEEVACEGEGSKELLHSEDLKATSEKTDVNGTDGYAYGISDVVLSSALHAPADDNYEICLGSNTDVLCQVHNDRCSDGREERFASKTWTNDIIEDASAKYIESGVVLPDKERSNLKGGPLNSKLEGTKVVESGLYFNKDIGNILDSGSVGEITPSGSGLSKDSSVECRQEVLDGFSMEASLDGSSTCGEKNVCRVDAIENPSISTTPGYKHEGALSEEAVCTMKNYAGTCSSNPRELIMELQSLFSKESIKEPDPHDSLAFPSAENSADESIIVEQRVKVHHGSNLSQLGSTDLLDEPIGCSNTEVLRQYHNHKDQSNEDRVEQVVSEPCTNDIAEEAAAAKYIESGVVLLPSEERSNLNDGQLNPKLESPNIMGSGLNCDKDVRNTSDNGSVFAVVGKRTPSGSGLPEHYPEEAVCRTKNYTGTCSADPRHLLMELQSLYSEDSTEKSDLQDNLAFSCAESGRDEPIICHVEKLVDTHASSEPDTCQGPCQDLGRHEEKESCMSLPMQAKESGGFLRSSHMKGSVTSAQIDLADDAHLIERDIVAAKQVFCEEKEETKSMPTSDSDVLHEKSYSNGHADQAACASETQFYHSQKASIYNGLHLGPSSLQLESLDALDNDILYVNTGVLEQHHKEGYYEHNVYQVTSGICAMSEAAPVKVLETGIDLETPSLPDEQLNPELDGDEAEKHSLNCEIDTSRILGTGSVMSKTALLPKDSHTIYCQELELPNGLSSFEFAEESAICQDESVSRSGICQPRSQKHIVEANSRLSSCDTELLHQDHKEESDEPNEDKFSPKALVENNMSEEGPIEGMESAIMLPSVAGTSEMPDELHNTKMSDESEELSFSCDKDTIENFCTGSAKRDLYPLPKDSHIDSCQKQEVPEVLSLPGSGPCQQYVNESTSMQATYNIEVLNQDHEEYNQNNEDQITSGIPASSVPEAVEIEVEQSEMEIGLIPATETSVLPVPDEQPNSKLEGNEDQITPGIPASSVPEAVEIEQSELEIGLIPAAETSVLAVPDEQPNIKLEGNEVDEHSCSYDKDFSILFDSESLKREASSLHKDDCMDLSSEANHPNDLPAPRSPEQSAYFQNDNDSGSVGICQSSRQRGIDELRAKLQSFKVSSTVKGSYIAMSAPRPKPGESMSQSAIALLRNIENTTAVKAGHPVKPNADGKDSSRRALQPISGRPREH